MRKRGSTGQLALSFEATVIPPALMVAAYERCRLRQRFEVAIATPHLAICLRNVALAGLRRGARK